MRTKAKEHFKKTAAQRTADAKSNANQILTKYSENSKRLEVIEKELRDVKLLLNCLKATLLTRAHFDKAVAFDKLAEEAVFLETNKKKEEKDKDFRPPTQNQMETLEVSSSDSDSDSEENSGIHSSEIELEIPEDIPPLMKSTAGLRRR